MPNDPLAIDGSHQEELVEKGYPGAEISYVTAAVVLTDVAKVRELDKKRPIDQSLFEKLNGLHQLTVRFRAVIL